MERNIDKISKTAAKVVLLVAFSVNSFDYSSINRKLNPLHGSHGPGILLEKLLGP